MCADQAARRPANGDPRRRDVAPGEGGASSPRLAALILALASSAISQEPAEPRLPPEIPAATQEGPAAGTKAEDDLFRVYWDDGIRMATASDDFRFRLAVRVENDWAFFLPDDASERTFDPEDGTELRRVRFGLMGDIYERFRFKVQYDFASGMAESRSIYLEYRGIPGVGNLRVGNTKEPFGLERMMSSRHLTFMERALTATLSPRRNTGFVVHDTLATERMTWGAGIFRTADSFGKSEGEDGYSMTGRLTGLPLYEEKGHRLLHLGLALSHRRFTSDQAQFRQRPESFLAPFYVDTGSFAAEEGTFVGLEGALVRGALSLQAEHTHAFLGLPGGRHARFHASYAYLSWFPTGEHRQYRRAIGTVGATRPARDLGRGGAGAWETALRLSHVDLDASGISGGRLVDLTLGVNWYMNSYAKIMWNFILADRAGVGETGIFQMRFALGF